MSDQESSWVRHKSVQNHTNQGAPQYLVNTPMSGQDCSGDRSNVWPTQYQDLGVPLCLANTIQGTQHCLAKTIQRNAPMSGQYRSGERETVWSRPYQRASHFLAKTLPESITLSGQDCAIL